MLFRSNEIDLKQTYDDDDAYGAPVDDGEMYAPTVADEGELADGGYGLENEEGEAEEYSDDAFSDLGLDDADDIDDDFND